MTKYEIFTTIIAILAIFISPTITAFCFSKRKEIYAIKKNAIIESLRFLDDYLSTKRFSDYPENKEVVTRIKTESDFEELNIRGRDCFNKLIITCKNAEIIDVFCKIIFPQYYYEDSATKLEDYHKFRMLCRKELGLNSEPKYNSDKITFLAKIR